MREQYMRTTSRIFGRCDGLYAGRRRCPIRERAAVQSESARCPAGGRVAVHADGLGYIACIKNAARSSSSDESALLEGEPPAWDCLCSANEPIGAPANPGTMS